MTAVLHPSRIGARGAVGAVDKGTPSARSSASRLVRVGVLAVGIFFATLLGVTSFHGVVVGEQFEFDRLQRRLDEAYQRSQVLRNEVARLESPDRVLSVAAGRLGMVPPTERLYLAVSKEGDAQALLPQPAGNPFAERSRRVEP